MLCLQGTPRSITLQKKKHTYLADLLYLTTPKGILLKLFWQKAIKTGILLGVSQFYLLGHTVMCKQGVISVSLAGILSLSESVTSHFS